MNSIVDDFVAPPCMQEIEVLVEEEHFLLINKPSGLLSLSGKNPLNNDSVHYRLIQEYPTASMVHRLDLGTSGIMLVALNKAANANLARQFQLRTVTKIYQSILNGHLDDERGQISAAIAKDPKLFPRLKVCQISGKQALTDYQVIERSNEPNASRVMFYPKTGRTHQLRIHSQYLGHPILGCDLYGTAQSHQASSRLLLHAEKLEFDHPITGTRVYGKCACPF
ncbi:RluA family pseudouridine synthase [Glaciecola sp. MF2-115]|uniref:RluA family pseudouridine synthase n=1 Tax=Glaciecola sp. MF2-115 TaxID=3384827 RepID=UPI0039A2B662